MPSLRLLLELALLATPTARAGSCDALMQPASGASGQALIDGYKRLISCDKEAAKRGFNSYMQKATDLETLVPLSQTAIDAEIWNPVWEMVGKIGDYETRDAVALEIGKLCSTDPKVVGFLQGAYFALRDIEFQQWDDALAACESDKFEAWFQENLTKPPQTSYDEKWVALGRAYIARKGITSLDVLTRAAIAAGNNSGPFEAALSLMEESILGALGDPAPEDQAALETALLDVAAAVPAENARSIADRLVNAGKESLAATLLPRIYPDQVQSGGGFLYGAVSVEECASDKEAYLHAAVVKEGGQLYLVQSAIEAPMRGFKAKSKCEITSPWPVSITAEPMKSRGELDAFLADVSKQWAEKGYEVKTRVEADLSI